MSIETNRELQRVYFAADAAVPGCIGIGKESVEHCLHHYEYSHKETKYAASNTSDFGTLDVVVCTKCGDVKRNSV